MPKVVFTKTLDQSTWNNTTLATGNLAEEIAGLKKQNWSLTFSQLSIYFGERIKPHLRP